MIWLSARCHTQGDVNALYSPYSMGTADTEPTARRCKWPLKGPAPVADSTTLLESFPGSSLEHLSALVSCPQFKVTGQQQLQVVDRQKRAENCGGCTPPPENSAIDSSQCQQTVGSSSKSLSSCIASGHHLPDRLLRTAGQPHPKTLRSHPGCTAALSSNEI